MRVGALRLHRPDAIARACTQNWDVAPDMAQAVLCRRRHQPRRPAPAKIRPGKPAPAMGPGTLMAPNSPFISPLIPSVKNSVLGLPLLPPVPKPRYQRPPAVLRTPMLPTPTSIRIVPGA